MTRPCVQCRDWFEPLGAARELCPACLRDAIPICEAVDPVSGEPCRQWTEAGQVFCLEHLQTGYSFWNKVVLAAAQIGERMTGPPTGLPGGSESRPGRAALEGIGQ
jgi:hypothetical protein